MPRTHAKITAVPTDKTKCFCGCGLTKGGGGKNAKRRKFLPGHSSFINPRRWTGEGRHRNTRGTEPQAQQCQGAF